MAYNVTASVAVSNATPKINQPTTVTLTVDNTGGTVDVRISSVDSLQTTGRDAPIQCGFPTVGKSEAGTADVPSPVLVAAGSSATFRFDVICFAAGATGVSAIAQGTRADDGTNITVVPASGVTITAS